MTDRTLTPESLDTLDFAKGHGLVPVVAQDADDGRVLMVAWADREALERSLSDGRLHFRSRSRDALWMKGESSGNVLRVVSLHADCDADTVLALVRPAGPACHTGEATCFGEGVDPKSGSSERSEPVRDSSAVGPPDSALAAALAELDATLAERQRERPEASYTVRLLDDENLRLKKLGEETAELVTALAKADADRAAEEAADLLYHILAALRGAGVDPDAVAQVLESRRG